MISIQPGACTYIGLRKTVSSRQPYPFSECRDLTDYRSVLYDKFVKYNKTYSQKACQQICKQKKVIDTCNCSVIVYPNVDDFRTCTTLDQVKCFWEIHKKFDVSECKNLCPLECNTVSYDFTTSMEKFPSYSFYKFWKANANVVSAFAERGIAYENITYEALSNSLACFGVYFEDISDTRIEENPAMTIVYLVIFI
jgi:hypothetical protein